MYAYNNKDNVIGTVYGIICGCMGLHIFAQVCYFDFKGQAVQNED